MQYFDDYLEENNELRDIIEIAINSPFHIQGVVLEIHPLFLAFWTLKYKFGNGNYDLIYYRFQNLYNGYNECTINLLDILLNPNAVYEKLGISEIEFFEGGITKNDLTHYWHILTKNIGIPGIYDVPDNPIIVRICYYPKSENNDKEQGYEPRFESRNFFIVHETRPVAEQYSTKEIYAPLLGGISIGVDNKGSGTLGGILQDSNSKVNYGLSCGHVVGNNDIYVSQPSVKDSIKSRIIGEVRFCENPVACSEKEPCNEYSQIINSLDVALIEISKSESNFEIHGIGEVSGIYSKRLICQDKTVKYTGRTSGHQEAYTGGYGVFYRLKNSNNQFVCYKGLLEIKKENNFWRLPWSNKFINVGDSGGLLIGELSHKVYKLRL